MLSKMGGELMLVGHMLGVRSIALTMIMNVDVEIFVYLVSGVPPKIQGITRSKFVE
jgi:hypothetical protein